MSKRKDGQACGQNTMGFKLEAVRLVQDGLSIPVTGKIIGVLAPMLGNWVRHSDKGQLACADDKPVSLEHMELALVLGEPSRVKVELEILKNAAAYFARESL